MIISTGDFYNFINKCSEGLDGFTEVIIPSKSVFDGNGKTFWKKCSSNTKVELFSYRTVDPLKILFYLSRERSYPVEQKNTKRLLVGAKACDLNGLAILDKALLDSGFKDPAYELWRNNTIIISSDCEVVTSSCHCSLLNGKPYAGKNFDLNISQIDDKIFVEIGSEKGSQLAGLINRTYSTTEANQSQIKSIAEQRDRVVEKLRRQNEKYSGYENFDAINIIEEDFWEEEARDCIGCASCTNVCPTCYCIIVNDESSKGQFVKVKSYDSCQLNGYARVAGGATPRPKMNQRLRNRYLCKFIFMKQDFEIPGCTGCGRCIDSDPSNIDIRNVVSNASLKKNLTASN